MKASVNVKIEYNREEQLLISELLIGTRQADDKSRDLHEKTLDAMRTALMNSLHDVRQHDIAASPDCTVKR